MKNDCNNKRKGVLNMSDDLYFKKNKTNGVVYLQIWRRVSSGKDELVRSIGRAEKILRDLVELDELRIQTKKYEDFLTKDFRGKTK
jgi:hypothetical protein